MPRLPVDTKRFFLLLFFLLFYLYFWLVIDPRLIHHGIGILTCYYPFSFHAGWPFFFEHLARTGGLVEYGARLLSQFFAFGWAGALIVTAAAWCMSLFSAELSRRAGRCHGNVLRYVPAFMVLEMYSGYHHPLRSILSLLAALGGFVLYLRLAPQDPIKRLPMLLLACLVLYQAAGAGSLLFPIMVAVDELLIGGRKGVAAAALACGVVVPWSAGTLLGLPLKEAYGGFLASNPGIVTGIWPLTLALYLFFPVVLAGTAIWSASRAGDVSSGPERGSGEGDPGPSQESHRFPLRKLPTRAIATAAFFSGIALVTCLSLDTFTRTVLETDYHCQGEQWTEVLRSADRLPYGVYSFRCNQNVILALYHLGRLGDEMFRYPQQPGVVLFSAPEEQRDIGTFYQDSRLFLDLGHVNHAERCAFESLAVSGDHPAVLQQLAMINVVKGRPETARIFLRALAKHPFHRRAARDMLRRLEADPRLEDDPRASRIRENMVDKDTVAVRVTVEGFFSVLLEKNPHNKMAFELLMAQHLISGTPDKVAANLARLKDFSYPRVPRHYQEAWIIHTGLSPDPLSIPGFDMDPEVLRSARDFRQITATAAHAQDAARMAREAGLGDSYFFYWAFGGSGR